MVSIRIILFFLQIYDDEKKMTSGIEENETDLQRFNINNHFLRMVHHTSRRQTIPQNHNFWTRFDSTEL